MQTCFRKAGISEERPKKSLVKSIIQQLKNFAQNFQKSFAMQCNNFIKLDEEIATSRDNLTDVDILAFTREELTSFEEEKDEIEGEEEPLECPACFQVDKAVKTLQQFALL